MQANYDLMHALLLEIVGAVGQSVPCQVNCVCSGSSVTVGSIVVHGAGSSVWDNNGVISSRWSEIRGFQGLLGAKRAVGGDGTWAGFIQPCQNNVSILISKDKSH